MESSIFAMHLQTMDRVIIRKASEKYSSLSYHLIAYNSIIEVAKVIFAHLFINSTDTTLRTDVARW